MNFVNSLAYLNPSGLGLKLVSPFGESPRRATTFSIFEVSSSSKIFLISSFECPTQVRCAMLSRPSMFFACSTISMVLSLVPPPAPYVIEI